ncbi:hypothetical protein HYT92_00270 [Candidatus Pacearchaeota archaeon]|nr:hypothetical protein [Candidatus Pacearchaeota archaeon]
MVLKTFQQDRTLLNKYPGSVNQRITAENIENLAANHLFDDCPKWFGISKLEGHKIRAYFQEGVRDYNFVFELYKNFPGIFEGERQEYANRMNRYRMHSGLKPFSEKAIKKIQKRKSKV